MKEKKNNKEIIWLIVVLIVLVLGLGGYIVYDKVVTNDNINNEKINSDNKNRVIGSLLPSDINSYSAIYWDYNDIYNYYFTMEKEENLTCKDNPTECNYYNKYDDSNYTLGSKNNFIKIENNKLYWSINNNWTQDENITNNIDYLYIDYAEGSIEKIIVSSNNSELYVITIKEELYYDIDSSKYNLTQKIYDSFEYKKVSSDKTITDISTKWYPADCSAYTVTYIKIDNNLYVLNNEELVLLEDYINQSGKYINNLQNTCSEPFGFILDINYDGTLKNVVDNNNKSISVKYYIQAYSGNYYDVEDTNKKLYDLIIDKNNKLYIIDRNDEDIEKIDRLESQLTVKNIDVIKKEDSFDNINITLYNDELIELNK